MTERVFNVSQPIVFRDGRMQYPFREFIIRVDTAITQAAITSVWGSINGDITTQDDLISGGKFLDSLVGESNVTQHEAALSIATSQLTGALPDARVAESNVTQHEVALKPANMDSDTATDGHVLTADGAGGIAWEAPASGGVSCFLKATGNLSSASFANTENPIPWNAAAIEEGSASTDLSISGSTITINTTGVYKFTVSLRTNNNNRTELFIRTYVNGVEDTAELVSNYVSRDGDQNTGGVVLATALSLTATDTVQFRGEGDCDGICTGLDDGTRLLIERVS